MELINFIYAAGGIVWRETARGNKLLLVNRTKYDDWSLPKGKLDAGERWESAALREVLEESACEVALEGFAGVLTYYLGLRPKVVLYWNMRYLRDAEEVMLNPDEIKAVGWFSIAEAMQQMTHEIEKQLIWTNDELRYRP